MAAIQSLATKDMYSRGENVRESEREREREREREQVPRGYKRCDYINVTHASLLMMSKTAKFVIRKQIWDGPTDERIDGRTDTTSCAVTSGKKEKTLQQNRSI